MVDGVVDGVRARAHHLRKAQVPAPPSGPPSHRPPRIGPLASAPPSAAVSHGPPASPTARLLPPSPPLLSCSFCYEVGRDPARFWTLFVLIILMLCTAVFACCWAIYRYVYVPRRWCFSRVPLRIPKTAGELGESAPLKPEGAPKSGWFGVGCCAAPPLET